MQVSAADVSGRSLEHIVGPSGYRTEQVEDYRARAVQALAAWDAYHRWLHATVRGVIIPAAEGGSGSLPTVTADILATRFIGVSRSGYHREQVDRLRADVDYTLRDYERRCAALRRQLGVLRVGGSKPTAPAPRTRHRRLVRRPGP